MDSKQKRKTIGIAIALLLGASIAVYVGFKIPIEEAKGGGGGEVVITGGDFVAGAPTTQNGTKGLAYYWDDTNKVFEAGSNFIAGAPTTLNGEKVLLYCWNSTTNKWQACNESSGSSGGVSFLSELNDVSTTSLSALDVLYWSGTSWLPTATSSWDTDTTCDGGSCNVTNSGTLDGVEGATFVTHPELYATTSLPNLSLTVSQLSDSGQLVTHAELYASTTLPNLSITESQISDLGAYATYANVSATNTLENYYLKTQIDTQGEVETIWGVTLATDTELAGQNECSEITNCVDNAWDALSDITLNENLMFRGDGSNNPEATNTIQILATGEIRFPGLLSCDTIDTDAQGDLSCGTDEGGGAIGAEYVTHAELVATSTLANYINKATYFSSTTPGHITSLPSSSYVDNAWDALSDISLTNGWIISGDSGGNAVATSSIFVENPSQFVGIQQTNPEYTLDVTNNSYNNWNPTMRLGSGSNDNMAGMHLADDGGTYKAMFVWGDDNGPWGTANKVFIGSIADEPVEFQQNDTSAMVIDTDQQIGIGTTTPDTKLEVVHNGVQLKLTQNDSTYNTFHTDADGDLNITSTATSNATTTIQNGGFDFGNGTNGMRVLPGASTTIIFY